MRAVTNAEFYKWARSGHDAKSARLTGVDVLGRYSGTTVAAGELEPAPAAQLDAALQRYYVQPGGLDLPAYVVSCDGTPVAWLTLRGHPVAPAARLNKLQLRHQQQALTALSEVSDHVLVALADRRDAYEQRTTVTPPSPLGGSRWVQVAAAGEPTRHWWTTVPADYGIAFDQVRSLVGADEVRVIRSAGYGVGANVIHHPGLEFVCAVQAIAEATGSLPAVVGQWAILTGCVDPATMQQQFAGAYVGRFDYEQDFTQHILQVRGWAKAMDEVGLPTKYLDLRQLTHDLLRTEFLAIGIDRDNDITHCGSGGIAVVAR
ncbi:hypothetical protein [Pilimelia columellifera]|uniref:GNAT family N-acetyltransferase n=1 Tax=Pilimelia columellifera subsp. columellifera TaxID=706583 RepID=A0ABN3NHY8_9ACTN